jgi:diaminopimelate decarboxylase
MTDNILIEAAEKFGTPLFVYDLDDVEKRYRELFEFLPAKNLRILYAMKANYLPALLKRLHACGAGIDTVSPGEIAFAMKCGFKAEQILFTANNLTDAESEEAFASGVMLNIGSISHLSKFAAAHPGASVCLRFNPDVVDGDSEKTMTGGDLAKFGILLDDLDKVLEIVRKHNIKVKGLHEHTGSGLQDFHSVWKAMDNLLTIAKPEYFPDLEFIDLGGGFKVPYRPDEKEVDYHEMGEGIAARMENCSSLYGRELQLLFEPGKFLAARCGYLLVRVNTIKHNHTRTIVGCDSGFPQLIRPVLYGAYHHIRNLSNPGGHEEVVDICGNICETGDRFAEQRAIPECREGDLLVIENAGAYCRSMGGIYNLRPMPPEAVVSGGEVKLARKGMNNQQMVDRIMSECLI